jgi:hypothetical protein
MPVQPDHALSRQGLMYVKSTKLHSFNMLKQPRSTIIGGSLRKQGSEAIQSINRGVIAAAQGRADRAWHVAIIEEMRFTKPKI